MIIFLCFSLELGFDKIFNFIGKLLILIKWLDKIIIKLLSLVLMACLLFVCNLVMLYICIISHIRRRNVGDWCRFWIGSFNWRWGRRWNWRNMCIMICCRSCWILRNVLLLLMSSSSIMAKLHGLALYKSINISFN